MNTGTEVYNPSKHQITDGELTFDKTHIQTATTILLANKVFLTYRAIQIITPFLNGVHTIDISNNNIGNDGALALGEIPTLRTLRVSNCFIEDTGAAALFNHTGIHRLTIDGNTISPQTLASLPEKNTLLYLKIDCNKEAIPHLSRCAIKEFEPNFIGQVSDQEQNQLKKSVRDHQADCDAFIRSTREMLTLAKWKAPAFKGVPTDVIKNICFMLGRYLLPKTPIQIASCIVLLDDQINKDPMATSLTQEQKGLAWTLVGRHIKLNEQALPPAQYIDEEPLKIFINA